MRSLGAILCAALLCATVTCSRNDGKPTSIAVQSKEIVQPVPDASVAASPVGIKRLDDGHRDGESFLRLEVLDIQGNLDKGHEVKIDVFVAIAATGLPVPELLKTVRDVLQSDFRRLLKDMNLEQLINFGFDLDALSELAGNRLAAQSIELLRLAPSGNGPQLSNEIQGQLDQINYLKQGIAKERYQERVLELPPYANDAVLRQQWILDHTAKLKELEKELTALEWHLGL